MADHKETKEQQQERNRAPIIKILEATEPRILDLAQSQLENAMLRQESPILDMSSDDVVELAMVTAAQIFLAFPFLQMETYHGVKALYSDETGHIYLFIEMYNLGYVLRIFNEQLAELGDESRDIGEAQSKQFANLIADMYQELAKPKSKKKKSRGSRSR